jgi:pyrrolidone-carboxylate peptidase
VPTRFLVTGFGSFERVAHNPSRAIATALEADPPPGTEIQAGELPVSFHRAKEVFETLLGRYGFPAPDVFLGLGVSSKGDGFSIERVASGTLKPGRPDSDGVDADALAPGIARATSLDVPALARVLRRAGAEKVADSRDAGGYVCEHIYHHMLSRGASLGAASLFLHVPREEILEVRRQIPIVAALVEEIARQVQQATREAGA